MLLIRRLGPVSISTLAALSLTLSSWAQTTPSHPPFTLRKHVREVITDITVTDAQGNPVTGLPQSAFHIYDNGHPQTIDSFTAHSGSSLAVVPTSTPSSIYSNRFLSHPPPVYNVALIDVTTMTVVEQMLLRKQLVQFLHHLPPTEPLAIYARDGPHMNLVQNFTTSRHKLLSAVRRTIPRFRPGGIERDTDYGVLKEMAEYLSQYPGRKNLLWLNGGSNLFLLADENGAARQMTFTTFNLRPLYDALAAERIAFYPIDVRGLTQIEPAGTATQPDQEITDQQSLMRREAEVTGGRAYFNNNSVSLSVRQILDQSADFYTITYSPNDLHHNARWHRVRVRVDGPYQLSYRHGYFDDNDLLNHAKPLTASNGDKIQAPDKHSTPILFQARITPSASPASHKAPRGTTPYLVRYALPAASFPIVRLDAGHSRVTLGVGTVILDGLGNVLSQKMRMVELRLPTAEVRDHPHGRFAWQQTINLPKGQDNVYLAVWNPSTGRLGTIQIPLTVKIH